MLVCGVLFAKRSARRWFRQKESEHDAALDQDWERHVEAGGDESNWEPRRLDRGAAKAAGEERAARAMSRDLEAQTRAYDEVSVIGMDPVEIMCEAYRSRDWSVIHHHQKLRELEGRRREVKRDFDALQRARPVEATVIES
jgi:hypothetical protein